MDEQYDVIIVGAGIVGSSVARSLSRYDISVLLIEKEADVCQGTSSANSRIIHAGYDPMPGTLKAQMNVRGNAMWGQLAGELGIPLTRHGTHVVALDQGELARLDELLARGKANGVPGLAIISGDEMRRREPAINSGVAGALRAETGSICDPWAATVALVENACLNGTELRLKTAFEAFVMHGERVAGVATSRGTFECKWAINAAGLYADEVMHKAGVRPEFEITPRRGEYYVLGPSGFHTRNTLWPVPTPVSKGIGVTTTIYGNTLVGANAQPIEDKEACCVTNDGLREVRAGSTKLVPLLRLDGVIGTFAGLRASGNARCENSAVAYTGDFVVEIPRTVRGFVNIAGIDSPGLTAAPAIAERVIELLKDEGELQAEKRDWDPERVGKPHFLGRARPVQAGY